MTSLYYDTGYIQFNVNDVVTVAPGDSLDLTFEIFEGDIFEFGDIKIAGNTKTKDYVIRRELRVAEGGVFNAELLKESVRRLNQLGYFQPLEGAASGPIRIRRWCRTKSCASAGEPSPRVRTGTPDRSGDPVPRR